VERSSDVVNISGNSITCDQDAREGGTGVFIAIKGGANQNSNTAGQELVAGNTIDLNKQEFHHFYECSNNIGDVVISGNQVSSVDNVFSFPGGAEDNSLAQIEVSNNVFSDYRSMGDISLRGHTTLNISGNSLRNTSSLTASSWTGNTTPKLRLQIIFNALSTYSDIFIDSNVVAAAHDDTFIQVELANNASLVMPVFAITGNRLLAYNTSSGASLLFGVSAATITDLIITHNMSKGDITLPAAATLTNEYLQNNTFLVTASSQRRLQNTGVNSSMITGGTSTTVGSAGGASALPATPSGYLEVIVNSDQIRQVPFFAL